MGIFDIFRIYLQNWKKNLDWDDYHYHHCHYINFISIYLCYDVKSKNLIFELFELESCFYRESVQFFTDIHRIFFILIEYSNFLRSFYLRIRNYVSLLLSAFIICIDCTALLWLWIFLGNCWTILIVLRLFVIVS